MSNQARWPSVQGYEIVAELGRGGFGDVYEARQVSVDRTVALKILGGSVIDEAAERRFRSECKTVGSLSWHPHVVSLYDAGICPDGRPYLAMELVPGGPVSERIRAGARLESGQVRDVGIQIADALSAAHDAGILHRDIKPDNILIDRRGGYLLTDFGIATLEDGTRSTTGSFAGTYAYLAPELLKGERATPQSDVYSLGATLYTLAAGVPAFTGTTDATPAAVIFRVVSEPAPPLSHAVHQGLRAIIEKAMSKDPSDRYQSAAELEQALKGITVAAAPLGNPGLLGPRPGIDHPMPGEESTVRRQAPAPLRGPREESAQGPPRKGDHDQTAEHDPAGQPTRVRSESLGADGAFDSRQVHRPGARRRRAYVAAGVVVAITLALFGAIVWSARNTYYVGFEGENVAIYRGKPGGVLWVSPELEEETDVPRDLLPADVRESIEGNVEFGSRADAVNYLVNLQSIIEERERPAEVATTTTTTTIARSADEPPYTLNGPVAETGVNAAFVDAFEFADVDKTGCRPLGVDPAVWTPPSSWIYPGFTFIMDYGGTGDRLDVTELSDGSWYYTEQLEFEPGSGLQSGRYLYYEIPNGVAGQRCAYSYGPLDDGPNDVDKIVPSLRWIQGH